MKTITFYSYKGGVGRTLALVNIANRLAEFGKKVCVMDFDLEAPGLNHKYKHNIKGNIERGLVDYIYEFAINDKLPDSIKEYAVEVNSNKKQNNITFIPAGNSEQGEYWKKLSRISWWDLFYLDNSEGIPFFLDLKAKIEAEFNPDYLLIDTRTGITEISAITMSILADRVALFAVNNDENICGTQHIIRTLNKKENNLFDVNKDIHFVLTRIPLSNTPEEKSRELEIRKLVVQKIKKVFEESGKEMKSFNVIHSDRETELFEKVKIGYDFDNKSAGKEMTPSILYEYLTLFNSLTGDDFTSEEKAKFNNLKRSEQLLKRAYESLENNSPDLFKILDEIEELTPELPEICWLRGWYHYEKGEYQKAKELFSKGIEKGDDSGNCLYYRALSNHYLKGNNEALNDLNQYITERYVDYRMEALLSQMTVKKHLEYDKDELISETTLLIEKYPYYAYFYNARSCLYYKQKQYPLALEDIYKAIDLDSDPVFYATLAEIKFCQGDKLEFYRNFDEALKKGFDIEILLLQDSDVKNIYKQASTDSEFIRILDKYDKYDFIDLLNQEESIEE